MQGQITKRKVRRVAIFVNHYQLCFINNTLGCIVIANCVSKPHQSTKEATVHSEIFCYKVPGHVSVFLNLKLLYIRLTSIVIDRQ